MDIDKDEALALIMNTRFGEICTTLTEIASDREDKTKQITFQFKDVEFILTCKVREDAEQS